MVVPDGASTERGAIWYQIKLVLEEAESWYRKRRSTESMEYQISGLLQYRINGVLDGAA